MKSIKVNIKFKIPDLTGFNTGHCLSGEDDTKHCHDIKCSECIMNIDNFTKILEAISEPV